jgi:hypothetical protein
MEKHSGDFMSNVPFINPFTGAFEKMPVEMIAAYCSYASFLRLEEAAKVAAIRDDEAATNLKLSCIDTEYLGAIPEGAGFDILSVEPPSLR